MAKFFKIFLITLCALFFTIPLFSLLTFHLMTKDAHFDESKLKTVQNRIEIYDQNDTLVKEVSLIGNKNAVKIDDVPKITVQAFCCIEDKRFFTHHGLDYKRILGASIKNIKSHSFKEGASTISQQLIKNTHLTGEKTIKRKLKEIKLTKELEKKYTKQEILEMYLNTIYFGHNCFGIADASTYYFEKMPKDLTIAESALLAGIIRSPKNYSPFLNPESCKKRRDYIITKLYHQNVINEREKQTAIKESLPEKSCHTNEDAYIKEVMDQTDSILENDMYGDIAIYTYLDQDLQNQLKAITADIDSDVICAVGNNENSSFKAFYSTAGSALKRSPGSTIKPLAVYAPALEEELICPATPILDEKTDFNGYSPVNFNQKYNGYVSARKALAESLNVPAVKILNELNIEKACYYLNQLNLPLEKEDRSLALALGGVKEGYPLSDLISAYGTFTHEGYFTPYAWIRKITKGNKTVYERKEKKRKVFSNETVSLLNNMTRETVLSGTAKKMKELPYTVYAKTGTSGTQERNIDAYTISYTKNDIVGVWLGNSDYTPVSTTGGGIPCIINKIILEYLYKNTQPKEIERSENIVNLFIDTDEYFNNHTIIQSDPKAPKYKTVQEVFSKFNQPKVVSTKYSSPTFLKTPEIHYDGNTIYIKVCHADYLIYCVRRKDKYGNVVTSYSDDSLFKDSEIENDQIYTYTLSPIYKGHTGKKYVLPKIKTNITKENFRDIQPDIHNNPIQSKEWWNE